MKRLLITTIVMAAALLVRSQNVQFEVSPRCSKGVIELTAFSDNTFGYCYTEMVLSGREATSMFSQVIWEQKWWQSPIFIHSEFRTVLTDKGYHTNTYLVGGAWSILPYSNVTCVLELLYRYENGVSTMQTTVTSGFDIGKWNYMGYIDIWLANGFFLYSEQKFFYQIADTWRIGVNLECGANYYEGQGFSFRPYGIIRKDF